MTDPFVLIAAERRATADFLDTLTDDQGDVPSLCAGWSIRHVAAHLTMPFSLGKGKLVLGMLKHRGDFNRFADTFAREAASQPIAAMAANVRVNAENRFTPPGLGAMAPLTDILVHTLDIRVPLGVPGAGPAPEAVNTVLDFLMTPKATRGFLPKDRVPGLSFGTTDTGWSGGSGPEVRGPATSLLLALTGRTAGLDALQGDGVAELTRRVKH